jgi:PPOX class probable F420-dependent enzyme
MATLPDSACALVDSGASAHLVTINPDGTPQITLVWAGMEDGEICVGSITPRQKLRNVRRDPRVAISFESPERDRLGLTFYLVVNGTARITEGGAPEFVSRLAERRLPAGTRFPRGEDHPPGWIMRITPERWRGYGPWVENVQ